MRQTRVLHPMAKLLPEWKHVGTSWAFAWRTHHCLREEMCWSISHRWMPRETSSFIWEGFKIASGMQRNYHDVARCSLSALPWFTVRPLWVFIPRQWRGTDSSGPWSLSEEVFNSNRRWMLCWCSSQLEGASWQVAFLRRWTRPHNSSLPSRESSNQVYKDLFCRMHPVRQMLLLWKRPL